MNESSAELLSLARSGDREALGALLERHQAQIYRFGMRMCRDPEDAKDVLQDTLLAMARGVREFRGASSISTWLYSVARSFCIKKRRRSKFAPHGEQSLEEAPGAEGQALHEPVTPDDALAGKQVEQALEQAIGKLDPKYREVLVLRDVEGLTAPEVAEVLGISVQAVKSRLHRARLDVRSAVGPLLGVPTEPSAPSATCPEIESLFSRYLEGEISPEVCADMQLHIEGCARCRAACGALKETLALCRKAASTLEVPPDVRDSVRVWLRELTRVPARS